MLPQPLPYKPGTTDLRYRRQYEQQHRAKDGHEIKFTARHAPI